MCIEKENGKPVKHRNEPLMVAFQEIRRDRWEDISGPGASGCPSRHTTQAISYSCTSGGSAATTLSNPPENSISISVFYK